jgi:hypothetical protein
LIGEGSDAGFATRCRNAISDTPYNHVPRLNYPTDEYLAVLSEAEASWPSPPKARMLVNIALWHVSDRYHVVLKSQVLHNLEQNPSLMNVMTRSKMMALFAIGELYSSRAICKNRGYPGLPFFAKATGVLSIMSERPHLDAIEIRLLLVRIEPDNLSIAISGVNNSHSRSTLLRSIGGTRRMRWQAPLLA